MHGPHRSSRTSTPSNRIRTWMCCCLCCANPAARGQQQPHPEIQIGLGLPFETLNGWFLRDEPTLVESLFGELTRELRESTDITDNDIAGILTDAAYTGVRFTSGPTPEDEPDAAMDEFR